MDAWGVSGWPVAIPRATAAAWWAAFVQCSTRTFLPSHGLNQRATSPTAYTPGTVVRSAASHSTPSVHATPEPFSHSVLGWEPTPTTTVSALRTDPSESRTFST